MSDHWIALRLWRENSIAFLRADKITAIVSVPGEEGCHVRCAGAEYNTRATRDQVLREIQGPDRFTSPSVKEGTL